MDLSRSVRNFLVQKRTREFLTFFFFFLVALAFWFIQTLDQEFETTVSFPLRLRDVPEDVVMTYDETNHLDVTLRDKGSALLNYQLTRSFYPLSIQFSSLEMLGSPARVPVSSIRSLVASQLPSSAQILSIKPDTLEYYYSKGQSKKVPVRLSGKISSVSPYFVSDTVFTPDSVLIYAADGMLDTIRSVRTEFLEAAGLKDTVSYNLGLSLPKGVKAVPEKVGTQLLVDIYTEKTLEIPVQGVNFPANRRLKAFPGKVKITFQVPMSRYRELTEQDFHILVSYEQLSSLKTDYFPVQLRSLPEGVRGVRFSPERVDFLIEEIVDNGN